MASVNNMFDKLERQLDEAKNRGEAYIMAFKPYNRRVIINPTLIKNGDVIYATNEEGSFCVNLFNFDEFSVGVTDNQFYMKYDHNNIIVK